MRTRAYIAGYRDGLRDAKRSRRNYRDDTAQVWTVKTYDNTRRPGEIFDLFLWCSSHEEAMELYEQFQINQGKEYGEHFSYETAHPYTTWDDGTPSGSDLEWIKQQTEKIRSGIAIEGGDLFIDH